MDILRNFREHQATPAQEERARRRDSQLHLPQAPTSRGRVIVGLDLGRQHDYTALAISQRERRSDGHVHHVVRSVERLPLGTPYPSVADRVAQVIGGLRNLAQSQEGGRFSIDLVIDNTGVGVAFADLLRERRIPFVPVTITAGDRAVEREEGAMSVGKSYLVHRLEIALQTKRLHLPDSPEAGILVSELQDYQAGYTSAGNVQFNARSGRHDDLVLALALAVAINPPPRPVAVVAVRRVKGRW